MNYKLTIQYDGTEFHGWQVQGRQRTVQGELTRVLQILDGRAVQVNGSGRTDAGVHAAGQVASVTLTREYVPETLLRAVNGHLAQDVRVMRVESAPEEFHARFDARGKTYIYRVMNAPVLAPCWARYALREGRRLDLTTMRAAANLLTGTHDWTAFSSARSDALTRVRTLSECVLTETFDDLNAAPLITLKFTADGFLRYMVRSLVGALLAVGRGELSETEVAEMLATGRRKLSVVTAPPRGLTLLKVHY